MCSLANKVVVVHKNGGYNKKEISVERQIWASHNKVKDSLFYHEKGTRFSKR